MKLLSFAGRKQSGKDSLGNFLLRNSREFFGTSNIRKYGWADVLKRQVGDLFGVPDDWLWGSDEDKKNLTNVKWGDLPHWYEMSHRHADLRQNHKMTVRELLQQFGTEVVRRMDKNAWVRAGLKQIQRDAVEFAVIIDTRFPNEVAAVKEAGGRTIRLTRKEEEEAGHESEYALDPDNYDRSNFDAIIDNAKMNLDGQERVMVNLLEQWGWKT